MLVPLRCGCQGLCFFTPLGSTFSNGTKFLAMKYGSITEKDSIFSRYLLFLPSSWYTTLQGFVLLRFLVLELAKFSLMWPQAYSVCETFLHPFLKSRECRLLPSRCLSIGQLVGQFFIFLYMFNTDFGTLGTQSRLSRLNWRGRGAPICLWGSSWMLHNTWTTFQRSLFPMALTIL